MAASHDWKSARANQNRCPMSRIAFLEATGPSRVSIPQVSARLHCVTCRMSVSIADQEQADQAVTPASSMKRAAAALPVFASLALGQDTPIYQYSPATVLGCECVSECKESPFAGCFAAPICKVKDKKCAKGTASWSLPLGSHDYCSFPEYKPYEELMGQQKQKLLWNRISQNTTAGRYPAALSVLTGLMGESVQVSF